VPLFAGTLLISGHRHAGRRADRPDVGDLHVGIRHAEGSAPSPSRLLEILAGIPTVVYGFFAALTVAPLIREIGGLLWACTSPRKARWPPAW
jgi:phosphate transport system permease protein